MRARDELVVGEATRLTGTQFKNEAHLLSLSLPVSVTEHDASALRGT